MCIRDFEWREGHQIVGRTILSSQQDSCGAPSPRLDDEQVIGALPRPGD